MAAEINLAAPFWFCRNRLFVIAFTPLVVIEN
jgi:hypothetical protein